MPWMSGWPSAVRGGLHRVWPATERPQAAISATAIAVFIVISPFERLRHAKETEPVKHSDHREHREHREKSRSTVSVRSTLTPRGEDVTTSSRIPFPRDLMS